MCRVFYRPDLVVKVQTLFVTNFFALIFALRKPCLRINFVFIHVVSSFLSALSAACGESRRHAFNRPAALHSARPYPM
jgi:hypothetical protein